MSKKRPRSKREASSIGRNNGGKGGNPIKARKDKDPNYLMKCVVMAGAGGILVILLVLCILAVFLTMGSLPIGAVRPIGVVVGCLGALSAGFFCSRMSRQDGFFLGLICAAVLFAVLFLVSLAITSQTPGMFSLVKLLSMLICGAVGGSIGVNMKRKV